MEIKCNPPVDAPAGAAMPGRPERAHDPETHQRRTPGIRSKGQHQRPERRIGRLGTIDLDRRLELQGDNIRARIAPATRARIAAPSVCTISAASVRGNTCSEATTRLFRHRVPLNGGDRGARIATIKLCADAVADASAAESCSSGSLL